MAIYLINWVSHIKLSRFIWVQRREFSFNQYGLSISKCSSIANFSMDTLFVDIDALRAEILTLKVQICLHFQTFWPKQFAKKLAIFKDQQPLKLWASFLIHSVLSFIYY